MKHIKVKDCNSCPCKKVIYCGLRNNRQIPYESIEFIMKHFCPLKKEPITIQLDN